MANVPVLGRNDLEETQGMLMVSFEGDVLFIPAPAGTRTVEVDADREARKVEKALDFASLVDALDRCHLKRDQQLDGLGFDPLSLQGFV